MFTDNYNVQNAKCLNQKHWGKDAKHGRSEKRWFKFFHPPTLSIDIDMYSNHCSRYILFLFFYLNGKTLNNNYNIIFLDLMDVFLRNQKFQVL